MAEQEKFTLSYSGGQVNTTVSHEHEHSNKNLLDSIASQTAYSAKGTATKIPQITTNALGQVTTITEIEIGASNDNQTISVGATSPVTFGSNTVVNFRAGSNITLTPSATNSYVEFSATDTTYTIATGDSVGTVKLTPSSGTAQSAKVNGFQSISYDSSTSTLVVATV